MSYDSLAKGGSVKLVRDTSISRSEEGTLLFTVDMKIENAYGFSEAIMGYSPGHLFVTRDSRYLRLATWDDLMIIKAGHPEEIGGEYRADKVRRQFNDAAQGIAWIKTIETGITNLLVQVKDYVAVYNSVKHEQTVLPKDNLRSLYDDIQTYLLTVKEREEVRHALNVSKGKLDVLNEVTVNASVSSPNTGTVNSTALLKTTLPEIQRLVNDISYALKDAVGLVGGNQPAPSAIVILEGKVKLSLSSILHILNNSLYEAISEVTDGGGIKVKLSGISDDIKLVIQDNSMPGVEEAIGKLNDFIKRITEDDKGLQLMSKLMTLSGVETTTAVNAVESMNIVNGVKSNELQVIRVSIEEEIKQLDNRLHELTALTQRQLTDLRREQPELDANDPMKIFNYRIFSSN